MTTYSRLDTVLSDKDHYPLGPDCSLKNKVIKMDWLDRLFAPRCPRCKRKMSHVAVGIERNSFSGTSRITQWYGDVCTNCGIVEDNNGDIN